MTATHNTIGPVQGVEDMWVHYATLYVIVQGNKQSFSGQRQKADCMVMQSALTCLQANKWVRLPPQAPGFGHDRMVVE